jgi:hypothetical protein
MIGKSYEVVSCNTLIKSPDIYEVTIKEGHAYAKRLNAPHFDTSAKLGVNIQVAVEELVRLIRVSSIEYHSYISSIYGFSTATKDDDFRTTFIADSASLEN